MILPDITNSITNVLQSVTNITAEQSVHFTDKITYWLQQTGLPPWLVIVLIATIPILELRGAIPFGVLWYVETADPVMTWGQVILFSIIGNLIPVLPILFLLEPIRTLLGHIKPIGKLLDWAYARAHKRGKDVIERYGWIGLSVFVGIPLPVTGAWTGSMVALVFDIEPKKSIPAIILGVIGASIVVTAIVKAGFEISRIFSYQTLAIAVVVVVIGLIVIRLLKKKKKEV